MPYVRVWSGLCNRIAPLLSMYRICRKKGLPLYVVWEDRTGRWPFPFHGPQKQEFCQLFRFLEGVYFIKKVPDNLEKVSTVQCNYVNITKDTYIHDVCHLLGDKAFDKESEVKQFQPWPRKAGIMNHTAFTRDIMNYFHHLRPVPIIQDKIDSITKLFSSYTLGVHIRRSDHLVGTAPASDSHSTIDVDIADRRIFKRIDALLEENPETKLFLATDHFPTDKKYRKKYKSRIIAYENFFGGSLKKRGENSNVGNMNAVVDLFCLAKCNHIIGSVASSFSNTAWFLSNNALYEILTGSEKIIEF